MRLGLAGRILVVGGLVVAFFVVVSALFIGTIGDVRESAAAQRHAEVSILAANRLQRVVLELETGQRGYVITGDRRFLQTWRDAVRELPAAEGALRASVAGSAAASEVELLAAEATEYLNGWTRPVVEKAHGDLAAARRLVASGAGRRRVEAIRAETARLAARQTAAERRARRDVSADERRGVAIGVAGVAGTALIFLGVVGAVLRAAVWPLRRLSLATGRLAGGELGARVPPGGAGEIGHLAASFNTMAESLQRSRDELERALEVNRAVLDATVDGICLTDREGAILLTNRPMDEFVAELGLPRQGTVPERLLAVAGRFTNPETYRTAMRRIAATPDAKSFDEFEFRDTRRCFQGFTAPVHDPAGAVVGRVWTLREVTREREADRAKDEFLATVSHELRTPLTTIVGFLEMLLEEEAGPLSDSQRQYLEIVQRGSQRLMRQVGDLLFLARVEQAGLELTKGPVSLDDVASEAVAAYEVVARSRDVELRFVPGSPPPLLADRERLAQVAGNLLSNAVKFTPAGGRVEVRTLAQDGAAVLEIEDTGIGIPEDERDRLFERFYRSSKASRAAVQGTGLGLAIAKAIVEAHGGRIAAEAGREGALFRVELPA